MAQVSKAIIPRDIGGPSGRRIKITVSGELAWTLRVVGFVTQRSSTTEWQRYSLVVMNWNDNGEPTSVATTILFRGVQTTYNFPLGLTTLWWYAPELNATPIESAIIAEYHGAQSVLR
ncbi:hypothetical protein D9619_009010 [Psilocybe cf. subviscida]|uniref:Uncharacterized protein n=1 Tax=Psilocybe cf. subviscida TaxID=2480587 RepID=A0A8H5BTV4_9AGAR|nr:hypothetical protein D9619_009010 [Psilocybe cf. subviscida]